jgi:trehalose transport system substrate-binding protein
MQKKTHRILSAAVLGLVAAAAIGCAQGQKAATEDAGAPAGANVLTFYTALGQSEWNVLKQEVFPEFEKANNCTVRAIDVASGEVVRKLDALRQSGRMDVDVIGQDNMELANLIKADLMDDLSDQEAKLPKETIGALKEVGRFDGKLFFLPYRPNVEITYYNETFLNKHGLKPPTDWNELMAFSKTLYDKEGIGRVAIKADGGASSTVHLFDFINQAGGDPMVLNDKGCVTALSYLRDLWPYLSPESRRADYNTMNQFLAMESVYIGQNWPFGIEVMVNQGEKKDIKAYHGWRGPVREAHTLGGEVFGIPKGAPNKALALKFIAHIQSQPVQTALAKKLAWPSMRTDAYAEVPGWQKPYFEAVKEALAHTVARPNVPYWEDFDKSINAAFREIVVDKRDVQVTLDKYAQQLEKAKRLKTAQKQASR